MSESNSKGAVLAAAIVGVSGWGTALISNWDKVLGEELSAPCVEQKCPTAQIPVAALTELRTIAREAQADSSNPNVSLETKCRKWHQSLTRIVEKSNEDAEPLRIINTATALSLSWNGSQNAFDNICDVEYAGLQLAERLADVYLKRQE